jgi:hypothetical protein
MAEQRSLPPRIEAPTLSLDEASDADILTFVQQTFAMAVSPESDEVGLARERVRLATLLRPTPFKEEVTVDAIIRDGVDATNLPDLLRRLEPSAGREVVEAAAAFSFPPQTHVPLRSAGDGTLEARAFAINAMPLNVAQALIRRAWIGQASPRVIAFRDQRWEELTPAEVLKRVTATVVDALSCTFEEAQQLLRYSSAPFFLLFMTRPMPPPTFVPEVLDTLPGAILFFLRGRESVRASPSLGVIDLPDLPEGQEFRFLNAYKRLMEIVAPRRTSSKSTKGVSRRTARSAVSQHNVVPMMKARKAVPKSTRKAAPTRLKLAARKSRKVGPSSTRRVAAARRRVVSKRRKK